MIGGSIPTHVLGHAPSGGPTAGACARAARARVVAHACVWSVLLLFPALSNLPGGVAAAQKMLHVAVAVTVVGLYVWLRPIAASAEALRAASVYCCVVAGYYVTCTLLWSSEVTTGDLSDLVRPFVYLLYFAVPLVFALDGSQLEGLYRRLRQVTVASIAFSALVYVPSVWPLVDLYKGRPSDDEVVMHFFRWSGTFGYPSDFSFFLSFFLYFTLVDWLRHGRVRPRDAAFAVVVLVGLVMTLSRGGLATTLAMCALIVATVGVRWRPRAVLVAAAVLAGALLAILAAWKSIEKASSDTANFAYVGQMFGAGGRMDRSTAHRVREAELAVDEALRRFPVGAGPNRERWKEEIRVIESLYGHLLLKWGVLGLLLYAASVAAIVGACAGVYRSYRADRFLPVFAVAVGATVISVPLLFGFSSAMSDRFKVLGVYYLLSGYVVALWAQTRTLRIGGLQQISRRPRT